MTDDQWIAEQMASLRKLARELEEDGLYDETVDHTTEHPVDTLYFDWTQDGRLVGVELLPGPKGETE